MNVSCSEHQALWGTKSPWITPRSERLPRLEHQWPAARTSRVCSAAAKPSVAYAVMRAARFSVAGSARAVDPRAMLRTAPPLLPSKFGPPSRALRESHLLMRLPPPRSITPLVISSRTLPWRSSRRQFQVGHECGLTLRSRRGPTARHQAREAVGHIIGLAGLAPRRWPRLTSNVRPHGIPPRPTPSVQR